MHRLTPTAAFAASTLCAVLARAAPLPPSTVPGSPPGWNWPMSLDAVVADPKNHKEIYSDKHVSVLEVTLWPHDQENMHGHPYPSVFAVDDVFPKMTNIAMGPKGPPHFGELYPMTGGPGFPHCMTMGPQNPHQVTIQEEYPQHFYRIQFRHLDPFGFASHWRTTYPELATLPVLPKTAASTGYAPTFPGWPFPIAAESVRAAPANYRVLFNNGKVRLLEVTIPPGATEPMNGTPYYAVNAFDSLEPGTADGPKISDRQLGGTDATTKAVLGGAKPPSGLDGPSCTVTGPTPPHQITNLGTSPVHYYRFEFLRVDGDGFAKNWKVWYPEMAEGPQPQRVKSAPAK